MHQSRLKGFRKKKIIEFTTPTQTEKKLGKLKCLTNFGNQFGI